MAFRLGQGGSAGDPCTCIILAGLLGTGLACSVDPYLFKIDGMWMVFVPFGVAVAIGQERVTKPWRVIP